MHLLCKRKVIKVYENLGNGFTLLLKSKNHRPFGSNDQKTISNLQIFKINLSK